MIKKKRMWNLPTRIHLFELITKKFGSIDSWPGSYPKEKKEFINFCDSFAKTIGAKSNEAVENQIRWATTTQPSVENMSTFIECKAAALETGFINTKLIPKRILCEY